MKKTNTRSASKTHSRAEVVRLSQAKRRKRLNISTITVEMDRTVHRNIKDLAEANQMTLQSFVSKTLASAAMPHILEYPWSVFEKELPKEKNCKFTHLSLFSGCGGFDLGLRAAGFKTILANDINQDASSTYKKNLGEIVVGDINDLKIPDYNYKVDIITAGFPCQPFSNAGSRKGTSDDRGTLFQSAIDIVKKVRPKSIIFENVRGILSFKIGNKLLIEEICEQLDKLGYDITLSLVDASNHHVAQKRLRLIIVGIERSKTVGKFAFPEPTVREDLSLEHIILNMPDDLPNQDEVMQLNPQAIYLGGMVPEGGSWKNIPYSKLPERLKKISDNIERYRWPNFYRRFHRTEIAGTITAAFKPENAGVWHPVEKRIFSVREISRIQSFPDWFIFEGKNIKSKYQQIGNAVPPRLAYEIGKQVIRCLNGEDLQESRSVKYFDEFLLSGRPLRASDGNIIFKNKSKLTNSSKKKSDEIDVSK